MEAFRQKQMLCHTTLAPAVAKDGNTRTLRTFHAPTRAKERDSDGSASRNHHSGFLKQLPPPVAYFNPLQRIQKMSSETLTDADAERIVYPFHASAITAPFEQVLVALVDKLQSTVVNVSWNRPEAHAEWATDLRFFGQWWLVLRTGEAAEPASAAADQHPSGRRSRISWVQGMHGEPLVPISTAALMRAFHEDKEEHRYAPLLPRNATAAQENQLVADLARRLAGPTDHLDIFHLSGMHMTADRLQVLFFEGFARLALTIKEERTREGAGQHGGPSAAPAAGGTSADSAETLSTLSFSSCKMGSAGLMVVLTGVASLAAQGLTGISTLDLSYNALQSSSLYCLTQMMRFTFIKRLSLRGNMLANVDVIPFREFLLEGCDRQVEELDLSYTDLTVGQVGVLIEALPRLSRLRVLLLEEVAIPLSKLPSLVRAVERTRLWHLRLATTAALLGSSPTSSSPSSASSVATYVKAIEEVCARNARSAVEANNSSAACAFHAGFFGFSTSSFFEAFFRLSKLKGIEAGDGASALPEGYAPFTGNDPSLP